MERPPHYNVCGRLAVLNVEPSGARDTLSALHVISGAQLKVELHTHTRDDPRDRIPYSTGALIDRAAELGYHALAITLHDKQLDPAPFRAYAAHRDLVLIQGIERTVQGKHVLLLNFGPRAETVSTFDDIAELKSRESGLVVAPHPFFPHGCALGNELDRHAELFDAVEINAMHVRGLDFNARAIRWAAAHGKPLVGNADVHRLCQLGNTYSLVDADPTPDSICAAIRAGRVEVRTAPLSWPRATSTMADMLAAFAFAGIARALSRSWRGGALERVERKLE